MGTVREHLRPTWYLDGDSTAVQRLAADAITEAAGPFGVPPLTFDGTTDALFQPFDARAGGAFPGR
jgi:hypothetical protein